MAYGLQPGVAFCVANGRAIFMEMLSGEYSHLDDAANAAFLRILEGLPLSHRATQALEAAVVDGPLKIVEDDTPLQSCGHPPPMCDEVADWPTTPSLWQAWRSLRRRRSIARKTDLDASPFFLLWGVQDARAAALRKVRSAKPATRRKICAAYAWADRRAPKPEHPLGRAVAMAEHLGRHGHRPDLVIGVTWPFETRAWLQEGDRVISDPLNVVSRFIPILAVADPYDGSPPIGSSGLIDD